MANPTFKRGLSPDFVDHLNELYTAGGWWRNLVDDEELFLAVRDNYVNFYFRGCSVLKLGWRPRKKEIKGEIHYKYLLKPSIKGSPYAKFGERGLKLPTEPRSMFVDDLTDVNELKRAVKRYADAEKSGVHNVVMNGKNPNVLDLEIAISKGKSAPRVDLAALHDDTDQPRTVRLVFYEAKHFKNEELRSSTSQIPVVDQIDEYSTLININRDALLESYLRICCNLFELKGVSQQNGRRHQILRDIATKSKKLKIDDHARLIAFGFDEDQRKGKNWKPHAEKLRNTLTEERVLYAGKAKNIRLDRR